MTDAPGRESDQLPEEQPGEALGGGQSSPERRREESGGAAAKPPVERPATGNEHDHARER